MQDWQQGNSVKTARRLMQRAALTTRDALSRWRAPQSHDPARPWPRRKVGFSIAVVAIGARVAREGGAVDPARLRDYAKHFTLPTGDRPYLERSFCIALRREMGFYAYARRLKRLVADQPEILHDLMDCLCHAATLHGQMQPEERAYLEDLARIFGLNETEWLTLCRRHEERRDSPHAILGFKQPCSEAAAKKRYRELIRRHHPDKLLAAGLPQEMVDLATLKMARINDAYQELRQKWERGW